jgi:hypothetical protein
MAKIFLSYASEDHARVSLLVDALEAHGHAVWWDRNLLNGSDFATAIAKQIRAADVVVVGWSARSAASTWVRDEAAKARDADRLVPVMLDPMEAPPGFRQFPVIDLSTWTGDPGAVACAEVLNAIEDVLRAASRAESSPRRPRALRNGLALLAGSLAIGCATYAAWLYV